MGTFDNLGNERVEKKKGKSKFCSAGVPGFEGKKRRSSLIRAFWGDLIPAFFGFHVFFSVCLLLIQIISGSFPIQSHC